MKWKEVETTKWKVKQLANIIQLEEHKAEVKNAIAQGILGEEAVDNIDKKDFARMRPKEHLRRTPRHI